MIGEDNKNWIVVSGDSKILKKPIERHALALANLTFFVMAGKSWINMELSEFVWKFFKVWPEIKENSMVSTPSIFEVSGGKSLAVTLLGATRD